MGFFNERTQREYDISQFQDLRDEAVEAKDDAIAAKDVAQSASSSAQDDAQQTLSLKRDVENIKQEVTEAKNSVEQSESNAAFSANTAQNAASQATSAIQNLDTKKQEAEDIYQNIRDREVVIYQYVTDVDNDRKDAEAARDEAFQSSQNIQANLDTSEQLVTQAQQTIDDASASLANIESKVSEISDIRDDAKDAQTAAEDARDVAITKRDEASTFSTSAQQSATQAAQSATESEGYVDSVLQASGDAQTAATTATTQAQIATDKATEAAQSATAAEISKDEAQTIVDSLGDISSGTFGVTSINGQSGIITGFDADDVNALSLTGGDLSGEITFPNDVGTKYGSWEVKENGDGWLVSNTGGTTVSYLTTSGDFYTNGLYDSGQRVYSPSNIPSANDLGALPDNWVPSWTQVTGKPNIFPTNWANVQDKPVFTTRWARWSEIDNKPATFPSTWDSVTGKPTAFPTNWASVSNKPSTFPSTWDSVSSKPATATRWPTPTEVGLTGISINDDVLKITNSFGTGEVGPKNTSWFHFYTDRNTFYFDKGVSVNGDIDLHNQRNTRLDFSTGNILEKGQRVYSPNNKPNWNDVQGKPTILSPIPTGITSTSGTLSGTLVTWIPDTTSTSPSATMASNVRIIQVKDVAGNAGTNNITLSAPSGKTIEGESELVIDKDNGWFKLQQFGSNFKLIGGA